MHQIYQALINEDSYSDLRPTSNNFLQLINSHLQLPFEHPQESNHY